MLRNLKLKFLSCFREYNQALAYVEHLQMQNKLLISECETLKRMNLELTAKINEQKLEIAKLTGIDSTGKSYAENTLNTIKNLLGLKTDQSLLIEVVGAVKSYRRSRDYPFQINAEEAVRGESHAP